MFKSGEHEQRDRKRQRDQMQNGWDHRSSPAKVVAIKRYN
jgi:hypothetical protein